MLAMLVLYNETIKLIKLEVLVIEKKIHLKQGKVFPIHHTVNENSTQSNFIAKHTIPCHLNEAFGNFFR